MLTTAELVDRLDSLNKERRKIYLAIKEACPEVGHLQAWNSALKNSRDTADIIRALKDSVTEGERTILTDEEVAELIRESRRD